MNVIDGKIGKVAIGGGTYFKGEEEVPIKGLVDQRSSGPGLYRGVVGVSCCPSISRVG